MSASFHRKTRPRSRADEVEELLAARIRDGSYRSGDKLPTESAIMQETGVSRTVVREALSRLQASKLVETHHGIGSFVLAEPAGAVNWGEVHLPTLLDVLGVLEVRISLETEAAALAALRRTDAHLAAMSEALAAFREAIEHPQGDHVAVEADIAFHERIATATGNSYFIEMLRHLGKAIIPRTRLNATRYAQGDVPAYLARVNREHQKILAAIRRRDAAGAREAMRRHLEQSRSRLQRVLDAQGEDLGPGAKD